jgi:hypothetical protein
MVRIWITKKHSAKLGKKPGPQGSGFFIGVPSMFDGSKVKVPVDIGKGHKPRGRLREAHSSETPPPAKDVLSHTRNY